MTQKPLEQFRSRLLVDEALQDALGSFEHTDSFVAHALDAAQLLGIALSREDLLAAIRPDPLGVGRWTQARGGEAQWPPRNWLPVAADGGGVDWAHFGTTRLSDPFFEMSAQRVRQRPLNLLRPWRMNLDRFIATASSDQSLAPSGFIFHMSRCGSTLVAQMLAAMPQNIVVSEAAPLDAIVSMHECSPSDRSLSNDRSQKSLAAMVAALGRRRSAEERQYVLKLDSWHALALPLFRAAFPETPWVFLYRDPIEVLVSQMRQRGMQMVPGLAPSQLYGIESGEAGSGEIFCARVLEKICAAAADHFTLGGGLLIHYDELPDATLTKILPHFGIVANAGDRARMIEAARRDAKAPHFEFTDDKAAKRREATERVHEAVRLHLTDAYAKLESLRSSRV